MKFIILWHFLNKIIKYKLSHYSVIKSYVFIAEMDSTCSVYPSTSLITCVWHVCSVFYAHLQHCNTYAPNNMHTTNMYTCTPLICIRICFKHILHSEDAKCAWKAKCGPSPGLLHTCVTEEAGAHLLQYTCNPGPWVYVFPWNQALVLNTIITTKWKYVKIFV